jgi:hypothetical protein
MVAVLPGDLLLKKEPVSQKFWTHSLIVLQVGTLPLQLVLKWQQNKHWVLTTDFTYEQGCSVACKISWFVCLWLIPLGIPQEQGKN